MAEPMDRQRRPRWSRREALGLLGAGAAGLLLGAPGSLRAQDRMLQRTIPASGERVPAMGLGTSGTFNVSVDDAAAMAPLREVMRGFVEMGGRVIDTSPMYGNAERVVGALAEDLAVGDRLFRATKVWTRGREAGIRQMERSRELMGGRRIDLMQVHNLRDLRTQLRTLRQWKEQGRIRYLGVTHYTVGSHDTLERLVRQENLDFVQLNLSVAVPDAEERLLPACADHGTATLINRPFMDGWLFRRARGREVPSWAGEFGAETWARFFLKYVLSHPTVTCAIPATSDPEHLRDNMRAGYGPLPDEAQRRRMRELVAAW